jgi:hypothetical protein
MSHIAAIIAELIQGLCDLVSKAAPSLAAPARPVYAGAKAGWVMPPNAHLPRLPGPVWSLLWFRLHRLANRITRLHDRWRAGTLPRPRTRAPRTTQRTTPRQPPARIPTFPMSGTPLVDPPPRLPRGHGWVLKRLPHCAAQSGRLHDLLQRAETRLFVEQAPQAARLLRPLCRALGVEQPAWLKLPPRPRKPRPPKPRAEQPRRWKLTDPELKLRPYEIAAARYFIKKYGRDG